jgi:hypothetical protein
MNRKAKRNFVEEVEFLHFIQEVSGSSIGRTQVFLSSVHPGKRRHTI